MKPKTAQRKRSAGKKSPARRAIKVRNGDKVMAFFKGKNAFWQATTRVFSSLARAVR